MSMEEIKNVPLSQADIRLIISDIDAGIDRFVVLPSGIKQFAQDEFKHKITLKAKLLKFVDFSSARLKARTFHRSRP